jgi:hypothetical protein
MHRVNQNWGAALIVGASLHASTATATDTETSNAASDETSNAASDETSNAASDETSNAASDETDTAHAKSAIGLRYRGLLLPKAVLNWFIEGGKTVYVHGVGPELSIPAGSGEYLLSAWLAFYSMSPVALKGNGDAEEAWEIVESQMKSLYLTIDRLWQTPLTGQLALSYGGGAGLGFFFGDLKRTQAALEAGGSAGTPDDYAPCSASGQPNARYCDEVNQHYGDYGEPNWLHGGSKPFVYPWLSGQVGLRFQPHEKLVTRLDLGVSTSGLFVGLGADYSL